MAADTLPLFGDATFYVYIYRDPRHGKKNVPIYVGKGTAKHGRAYIHWRRLLTRRPFNPILSRMLTKIKALGLAPKIEIVGWYDNEAAAFDLERTLIRRYGRIDEETGPLANLTNGGEGTSGHHSAFRGKTRMAPSAEARAKMSASAKGKIISPTARAKLSLAFRGRVVSKETREKIGIAHRDRVFSSEARAKMSASAKGRCERDRLDKTLDTKMKALRNRKAVHRIA